MDSKYDVLSYTREAQGIERVDVYEISKRNRVEPGGMVKQITC
jgi:hypothetical protein